MRVHRCLEWTAKLLALAMVGVVALFFVAEPPNPFRLTFQEWVLMIFFMSELAGLLVGLRWLLAGGCITVVSMALFYLATIAFTGRIAAGPAFLVIALPGFMYLAASAMKGRPLAGTAPSQGESR